MWLMMLVLFLLLAIGAPIGAALGASAIAFMLVYTNMDPSLAPASFFEFVNSYTLMAAPFFILAGLLMERSGLLGQIFDFADSLLGWVKGGLGTAALATSVVFAALTGSAVASASALGVIVVPRMTDTGYSKKLSTALVCAGGTLAELIPPSIWLIIYGVITETSVARLFFAGIVPGLILAMLLVAMNFYLCRNEKTVKLIPFNRKRAARGLKTSLPGLMLPIIVLGGLYGGVFTPTEAGAAACAYAVLYGYISRKGRFSKDLISATAPAMRTSAMLFLLLGGVGIFQCVAANQYWPQRASEWAISLGLTPLSFIAGYMVVILILGCFLDGVAMIALTVPVIFPVGMALGIDPLHLGILLVINCQLGMITPPLGLSLYAVSGVTSAPVYDVLRATIPFFLVIMAFLVVMIFMPGLTTWLPSLLH
jgi:C4-dicarboxylate transporter DctM subunit